MDNKNSSPTNQSLQRFALSNRDFETPLFESISLSDEVARNPASTVAIPSVMPVEEAKSWVGSVSRI